MAGTVLFANPSAQSGKAEELIADARRLLDEAGIEHEFIATLPDSGTIGLVRRAIDDDGARRIIYMGGDGTFADVAKGILAAVNARDVAMGMLPTGTANDQGKSFGLRTGPAGFADNVKVIAAGMTTEIDVGRIELLDAGDQAVRSDLFFDSASIGWGAAVLRTRNVDREAVAGIPLVRQIYSDYLVYAKAMVQHLLGQALPGRKFDMEVVVDGETHRYESLMDVVFKNTHVFAGEWVLSADAEADDGLFEMVPIAGVADFTGKILTTFRHNPIDEEDFRKLGIVQSEAVRGQSFDVTILQPGAEVGLPVQIDGEEFPPGDRFRIQVLQRVLRLIVPRAEAR